MNTCIETITELFSHQSAKAATYWLGSFLYTQRSKNHTEKNKNKADTKASGRIQIQLSHNFQLWWRALSSMVVVFDHNIIWQ